MRARIMYPDLTKEAIQRYCQEHNLRVVGFRKPRKTSREFFLATTDECPGVQAAGGTTLCALHAVCYYSDTGPRLIVERL